mgnify:CR=1 FL=1
MTVHKKINIFDNPGKMEDKDEDEEEKYDE